MKVTITITCINGHDATIEQHGSSIVADCPECEGWEEYRLVDDAAAAHAADRYMAVMKSRDSWRKKAERMLEEMQLDQDEIDQEVSRDEEQRCRRMREDGKSK